jgi:hypothetical protein
MHPQQRSTAQSYPTTPGGWQQMVVQQLQTLNALSLQTGIEEDPLKIRIPARMETTAAGSSVFLLVTLVLGCVLNQARENAESLQFSLDFLGNAQVVVAQGGVSNAVSANRDQNLSRMRSRSQNRIHPPITVTDK